ncbi:SUMF1/EgtB/PvdO family nonheme iron enzyme [Nocardioides sp. CER19]|uniref:SUMF1/EgtB/PvdO family nonheme iron enzyme n=1 Tax=Nocardioides sp. CER19 TaxID=3038538 RepID=UPI002447EB64|nr:SUMF1/EgtB/PvdO family nonheme iron enzyme [Nocardioides sp. CER19]MDH2414452.1 SUMF1/EgtB/PvdO family nonheme iron enzyme [Nocardioides sp. CER19]
MGGIFISYRRDPSAAWAGRIADRLRAHFGRRKVFIDVVDIEPGANFPEKLAATIRHAEAFLVIIDHHWVAGAGERPTHPISADDWVTREVSLALSEDRLAVIPVLVDGAAMPAADALPPVIRELAFRNAVALSPTSFEADLERLVRALSGDGARKTVLKRVGLVRGLLIFTVLGALALYLGARAVDAAQQSRLRAEARGPLVTYQGLRWERFEVTNRRYRACVDARHCDVPGAARTGERFDTPDRADLPVVSVSADQALAFCAWIGRRLPTRAEWQKAATRDGRATWPWGNDPPTASRANAITLAQAPPPHPPGSVIRAFTLLAHRDRVAAGEVARLIPGATARAIDDLKEDWPFAARGERVEWLSQLYLATRDAAPGPDPSNPDDVVVVTTDRAGGTSLVNGVEDLVGNAAEWTSTTPDDEVWRGAAATPLYVAGGSFADLADSLESDRWASSDEQMDTVGFRCVESG